MNTRVLTTGAAVAALLVVGSGVASASWSKVVTGGVGAGKAATLGAPTGGSAAAASATSLTISWSAPAGVAPTGYTLTRNAASIGSGGCSGTVATTSCTDSGLTSGTTYTYTVISHRSSWVSPASGSFTGTPLAFKATAVVTANHSGGVAGKPEATDTVTVTFNAPVDESSLCGSWPADSAADQTISGATIRITNGGAGNDSLTVTSPGANKTCGNGSANTFQFGSLNLGSTTFVTSNVDFTSSTIFYDHTAHTLTLTLGTAGGSVGTDAASRTVTYTPDSGIADTSGNSIDVAIAPTSTGTQF